jgi:hypothetical protein
MKRGITILFFYFILIFPSACTKQNKKESSNPVIPGDIELVNTAHLERLTVPVVFQNGAKADAVYIYSNAPVYNPAYADGEGFTCVDDVARAAQFYLRSSQFPSDPAVRLKTHNLLRFIINMQSENGYFYNFLQTGNVINKTGITSVNQAKWWSWRALQALTEAGPTIKTSDPQLSGLVNQAVSKLVARIKSDLINLPKTTIDIKGIAIPQWLPEGADAGASLILGLIPYSKESGDTEIKEYIRKLADGLVMMQLGDASHFPYSCFLSSGNLWHAYGSDQAHALFQAGIFLNEATYVDKALAEVDNFYPWLLQNGLKYSFEVENINNTLTAKNVKEYEQIAYGVRPMVSAAIDAFEITKNEKYAVMAGRLSAWFLGNNIAGTAMYSATTGRCYDAINAGGLVNKNAGAESCIEALLTMQIVSKYPAVKTALNKYK